MSTKPLVLDIASEIKMLQIEASKVPALENTLRELQSTVEKLSGVIDFMTAESSSASLPSLPMNLDPCIKESPNIGLHYYKTSRTALEMLRQL